ncbi:MAG: hypothetical protein IKU15_09580 [Clostridia bacterium]|nr:hypothetical protein [Clostridia bacterium]
MRPTRREIIMQNLIAVELGKITMEKARENIKEDLKFWGFQVAPSDFDNITANDEE